MEKQQREMVSINNNCRVIIQMPQKVKSMFTSTCIAEFQKRVNEFMAMMALFVAQDL